MRFVKISAIFSTVADLGSIRKRIFSVMALDSRIPFFKKNAFWQCIYFLWYFFYNFMKLPQGLVWKYFKQCINVCFVSMVYSPMLSISKLTYFKRKTISVVVNMNGGAFLNSKNNALGKIPILHVVYPFLKWTSCQTILWYLLFYSNIVCMNTITQLIISCVLHSLQFATNIS